MAQKKFNRSRTGCLTCRRRRKKCDGGKPNCQSCVRLKLACEYKEEKMVWQIQKLKPDGSTVSYVESMEMAERIEKVERTENESVQLEKRNKGDKSKEFKGSDWMVTGHVGQRVLVPPGQDQGMGVIRTTYKREPREGETPEREGVEPQRQTNRETTRDGHAEGSKIQELLEYTQKEIEKHKAKENQQAQQNEQEKDKEKRDKSFSPASTWSISNFFQGEDLDFSPSLDGIINGEMKTGEDGDVEGVEEISDITRPLEPYFNITSEVYLTYDTNVPHSLWGHRFNLPKFVSVESAEILLSYFCERIAPTFSVCRKYSSSLVCTYLPLASYDTMVLAGLLAWATLHFEKNGDLQFVSLKERLLKDIQRSLVKISSGQNDIPVEVTLATLLIMIAIENKGTSSNWFIYYKMAQKALKSSDRSQRTEDFNWLKNNLLYHEVTAPSLLMVEENPEEMESYFKFADTYDDMPEAYMGICKSIYKVNRDIFKLSRKLVTSSSIEVLEEVCREAEVLEARIEACKTLEPTEEMVLNGTLMYHKMFFQVLKDTARLYIRQCVYMEAPVSIKSTMLVGRIVNTIKQLFGTVMDPALLFPLFILGVDTVTKYVRDWVIKAMRDLHKRVGSGNILVAIDLLHKIWHQNNEGRIHVLWPQVAKENGMLVSLA